MLINKVFLVLCFKIYNFIFLKEFVLFKFMMSISFFKFSFNLFRDNC